MSSFAGKVVIVTGGTKNIGEAIARRLSASGATVVCCGRSAESGQAVADDLVKSGGRASFVRADVGDEADVEAVVKHAMATYGAVDVVVNNAAGTDLLQDGRDTGILNATSRNFHTMLQVGIMGPFFFFKHAGAVMTDGGNFVNISSNAGSRATLGMPGYAASKAGLEGLSRAVAADLAYRGIRSNVVQLGLVETPGNVHMFDHEVAGPALRALQLTNFVGNGEDVAKLVAFVASDDARYMNATTITIDGGSTMKTTTPDLGDAW
jgi:NAD(P)-dependent dehydrogenase (short-subunit alcohol dehydrogenase family)